MPVLRELPWAACAPTRLTLPSALIAKRISKPANWRKKGARRWPRNLKPNLRIALIWRSASPAKQIRLSRAEGAFHFQARVLRASRAARCLRAWLAHRKALMAAPLLLQAAAFLAVDPAPVLPKA